MKIERLQLSIQTVKENIAILESQEPEDAGYYLQLEHEKMVLDALEKQIPKKANISIKGTTDYNTTVHCPTCHKMLTGIKPRHCIECGQAIDWSE